MKSRLVSKGNGAIIAAVAVGLTMAGAPPAFAATGLPMAPSALVVDDSNQPLDVAGTPAFGWIPRDGAGDEIQTGYQIRVTDGLTHRLVWDSRRVPAGAESDIDYAGPALADGHSYDWTVRTWNREGNASPWAAPAFFDTGINDNEWSGADWIRRVTTGNDSLVDYTLARRTFAVTDRASPVVRARVYLAAEGQWQLHVNGRVVDTQDDYQMPGETYYDVEDITGDVRDAMSAQHGEVTVGVKYGAWATTEGGGRPEGPVPARSTLAASSPAGATTVTVASATGLVAGEGLAVGAVGSATFVVDPIVAISGNNVQLGQPLPAAQPAGTAVVAEDGPTGLLVKVVVDHQDGSEQSVVSDGSWSLAKDTEELTSTVKRRSVENAGTYVEYLDARQRITGWDQPDYRPSSAWQPAMVLGRAPMPEPSSCANYLSRSAPCGFTHLQPMLSALAYHVVRPVSVHTLADGTQVADFGTDLVGVPSVRLPDGVAGRQVTLLGSYRLNNTTSTAPADRGASTIAVASTTGFQTGDPVTVDAPADGYGAGHPEPDAVASVSGDTITLRMPMRQAHAAGIWVQGARSGTSPLDTQGTDLTFAYTEAAGAQDTDFYVAEGFRYLMISGAGEHLDPQDIWVTAQNEDVPAGRAATFTSDNPTLNAVFALLERAAVQSGQMEFQDSPDRQAGQFLGDAVDESAATTESLDERALTKQAIENFIASQQRYWLAGPPGPDSQYGDMNAVYPTGDGKRDIPDYTEMFPEWVWHYYQLTGDRDTLAATYPTMRAIGTYIGDNIASSGPAAGLVYQLAGGSTGLYRYGIVDWPPTDRYDTVVLNAGVDTVVNLRAVEVYRALADTADVLGDTGSASDYRTDTTNLTNAINTKLVEAGGLYDDGLTAAPGNPKIGNASEHDQSFALAYGVAPQASFAALGDFLATRGMRQGPMDLGQLERGLIDTGRTDALVTLLTDPNADGPAKILAEGGTTMWEQWDPGCTAPGGAAGDSTASCVGGGINQQSTDSLSHGWGSVGITGILAGLLGIQVTGAGASTVTVAPPASGLGSASGGEWTERGEVWVSWRRLPNGVALDVRVPDNMSVTVALPSKLGTRYTAGGQGAPQFRGESDGLVTYQVGAGETRLSPTT
jgi:hypothetical protein